MNFIDIKENDFILFRNGLTNLASDSYYIMYIQYIEKTRFPFVRGIILKTNMQNWLFTIKDHYYDDLAIIKKIEDTKEINELKLIYKMYLLQNS